MKTPSKTFHLNRNVTFFISLAALLAVFFTSFYYYYVPSNKEHLNKYAFLILNSIKNSIEDRNENLKKVYLTNLKDSNRRNSNTLLYKTDPDKWEANLIDVNEKQFVYTIKTGKDTLPYKIYKDHSLSSFFNIHKNELFDAFLLMKNCDSNLLAICKDGMIDAGSTISKDSLLKDNKGLFFPGTRSIIIGDIDYKMFYLPFVADSQGMVVCGFLKKSTYSTKLHEIPASFVYIFVILFLALLVALPVLRFFFMSHGEEVKFPDLFMFVFSLLTGSTLITLVIIQFMILRGGEIRAQANLDTLSNQIQSAFLQELGKAYNQLSRMDSLLIMRDSTLTEQVKGTNFKQVKITNDRLDTAQFLNFDRVAWSDKSGQQILKAEFNNDALYTDIKNRQYFKAFKSNETYRVPNCPDSVFGIEPLYNWVNGAFRTVISKRSYYPGIYIAALSCDLRSVSQTILPAGYKFCIIDAHGDVQYHSDSARNLHEYFIDYLETPEIVKGAINSRQKMSSNDEGLYGKNHCLNIAPVKDLPFYLVTFYDKSYIVSTNMRILIFALTLCFVSFITYLSLWYFMLWRPYQGLSVLQNPVNFSNWVIPKPEMLYVYRSFIILLLLYTAILTGLTIMLKAQDISNNYVMLFLMLITPFNLSAGVIVILKKHYQIPKEKIDQKQRPVKWILTALLITALCIAGLSLSSGIPIVYFILFETGLTGLLAFYFYRIPVSDYKSLKLQKFNKKYLKYYGFTSLLIVIVLGILPACVFTWYSHNQELVQMVKKQQLFMADKIMKRKSLLHNTLLQNDSSISKDYYMQTCCRQGIYTIYSDSIHFVSELPDVKDIKTFDEFYFNISNAAGNKFYEQELYPALKDIEADSLWRWYVFPKDAAVLFYSLLPNAHYKFIGSASAKDTYLRIKSQQPPRYLFLNTNERGAWLFCVILLILFAIYNIIKGMAAKVFLSKYAFAYKNDDKKNIQPLIDKYICTVSGGASKKQQLLTLAGHYNVPVRHKHISAISEVENRLITETTANKSFYGFIWQKCTEREKRLLYNFSKDGMLNFKNTTAIHNLFKNGLLIVNKHYEVCLFSGSFRLYILEYLPDTELAELQKKINEYSTWHSFRTPLLIILVSIACFIFFTQEQTWQRIVAFVTGFGSSLPLLLNIFSRAAGAAKK